MLQKPCYSFLFISSGVPTVRGVATALMVHFVSLSAASFAREVFGAAGGMSVTPAAYPERLRSPFRAEIVFRSAAFGAVDSGGVGFFCTARAPREYSGAADVEEMLEVIGDIDAHSINVPAVVATGEVVRHNCL